ncbi:MAG TPA: tetratricopeptide repeat protein [Opitutaceae bacterium]|nr:tetratricopeptide repeat protein [Opitutaceae bacterium]
MKTPPPTPLHSRPFASIHGFPPWLGALLLVALIVFAYQPAWNAGFVWDDDDYVTHNPLLSAPDGLQRIWFSTDSPSQYFPLVYTTFRIEHALWGLNSSGFHWVNILMHAANALLVWRLLQRLNVPGAWLAAAIFALHPVQVESVAWISELKNVQSLFFFLLALLAWVEFVQRSESLEPGAERLEHEPPGQIKGSALSSQLSALSFPRLWHWYALAIVCHALALFSKTTACTLPAALVLILWLKRKPLTLTRWIQVTPFVALGIAMGLVSIWWEKNHQGTVGDTYTLNLLDRVLVASRALWFYLGKLAWPSNLTFNYPLWIIDRTAPLAYVWLGMTAVLGAVIYYARRFAGRGPEVAAVFFAAMLSPLLGFVMLYTFKYTFVTDHYQYVAMLGPVTLAAAGISIAISSVAKRNAILKPACYGLVVATLAVLTWRQTRMYEDLETLWRTTIARNPTSYMGHNNLGAIFLGKGQIDEAIARFRSALEILPDHGNAHGNLANALLRKGQNEEAVVHFRRAAEIEPNNGKAHSDLAFGLLQTGATEEALVHGKKAADLIPGAPEIQNVFGLALMQAGRGDEAVARYETALKLQPDFPDAHYNLAIAFFQSGQVERALPHFQKLTALQPENPEAHNNYGWALLQTGRAGDAIACFQTVLKLQPDFAMAHSNLAIAHLQLGRPREAIARYESFLAQQPDHPPALADLAWVLATSADASIRNGSRALELARRANEFSGGEHPAVLRALAAAQAESGQFPEAVATARRALERTDAAANAPLADALRLQLKSYEAGSAFREPAPAASR